MIHCGLMQLEDVSACVKIVANHPVLGPRYGSAVNHLESAWRKLAHSDAFFAMVGKETASGFSKTLGSQIACFITDDFAAEIATAPFKWVGPELVNRFLHGPSPILTNAQVRLANSADGLNTLVWPSCFSTEYETHLELRQRSQTLFFEVYRGFQIKRLQMQAIHPVELCIAINSGAWYLPSADSNHSQDLAKLSGSVALKPHIVEVTRAMASNQPGSWVSQLFAYRKPEMGFPRSEQRLLSAALEGGTDQELAERLGISLSAVKKMWASAYHRIESRRASILKFERKENANGDRGREKKHKLLVYLRDHPEELRPYSMKLLDPVAP
jgi:DNA-binding CsgD family transcriptional regulator